MERTPSYLLLPAMVRSIREEFGIELAWGEICLLRHYVTCFYGTDKDELKAPLYRFMLDCFGLDMIDLGSQDILSLSATGKRAVSKYGMRFLGTDPFKRYCKANVEMWRSERSLP